MKRTIEKVLICIFVVAILLAFIGQGLAFRNNKDGYMKLQPEFKGPATIQHVFYNYADELIYVCFNGTAYVNVYDLEGQFKWALSTPAMKNPHYEIDGDILMIYDDYAYLYRKDAGQYLTGQDVSKLDLDGENSVEYVNSKGIFFDSYNVYVENKDGVRKTIVSAPWWHRIFNGFVDYLIAFIAIIILGIFKLYDRNKEYKEIVNRRGLKGKGTSIDKKAIKVINYYKVTVMINVLFGVVALVIAFFKVPLMIGAVPLVIHLIIAATALNKKYRKYNSKSDEYKLCSYWNAMCFVSGAIMVALMVVAVLVW